jgi:hypothetical protein
MKSLSLVQHTSAAIDFQIDVIGRNGRTLRRLPKRRNLIPNSALDALGAQTCHWRTCTNSVAVGTGALTTKRASGATTITATAGALGASAGFFLAADVGRVLKLDSGEEYIITGYTSPTAASSSNLTNAAASPGTIHYTTLTGLVTETERSSTVAPGGSRVSAYDATLKTWTHTIILLTPILATARVYTEIAWSWDNGAGGPIFGLAPISPSVNLGSGQRLRVTISVVVKPSPMAPVAVSAGLAVGNFSCERTGSDAGRVHFREVWLGTSGPALAAPSTSSSPSIGTFIQAGTCAFAGYSNGTYKRVLNFEFADSLGAITAPSLRLNYGDNSGGVTCDARLLFTSPLVKTANDRVNGSIEYSWGRDLVN